MAPEANRQPDDQSFSAKLRELRITAGLTQEDLAERTGLSVRGISDLERGARSRPHFETVRLLADALELDPQERTALIAAARSASGTLAVEAAPEVEPGGRMPIPATRLVGREQEIEEATRLLDHGEARLLTLTGPGGVGKTRLALEVASRSVDAENVVFVDLAPINDPDLVATSIVRALGLRDAGDRLPIDLLKEALRDKQLLLVLDNFEHVIAARSIVGDLLASCPKLKILVTSRTPLHLQREQEYPVPPLATPDLNVPLPLAELEHAPAVTLFVQRARSADPHFSFDEESAPHVVEVCHRLDGLPLAIELAAARVKLLPPEVLVGRTGHRLPLLTSGPQNAPARHQTMRATIAWSHDLLSPEAQMLFRRMSIFAGGCTLEAIEAVCAGSLPDVLDQLSELADQGFVHRVGNHDGSPHYRIHEVVREFAREKLEESGESPAIHQAYARYYLEFAEAAEVHLNRTVSQEWLERLERDHDNLRSALGWFSSAGDRVALLTTAANLWWFWYYRGHLREGRSWLERALAYEGEIAGDVRAKALMGLGTLTHFVGNDEAASAALNAALSIWKKEEDTFGTAYTLTVLGIISEDRGDYDDAARHFDEALALFRVLGDMVDEAITLIHLAVVAYGRGDLQGAAEHCKHSLIISRWLDDSWSIGMALAHWGLVACELGEFNESAKLLEESLHLYVDLGSKRQIADCIAKIGTFAAYRARPVEASRLLGAADSQTRAIGAVYSLPESTAYERAEEMTRRQLGPAAFQAHTEVGSAMTVEKAVAEALTVVADSAVDDHTGLTPREL